MNPPCDRCQHASADHQGTTARDWSVCFARLTERDRHGRRIVCHCDGYFPGRST